MKRISISALILFILIPVLSAQDLEKKQYVATHITSPPVINGILDDEAWQAGIWEDGFTQNQPYNGRPETQKTEFKIVFDDNNLYVAIKAYDTAPDSIVNRLTRRDEADGDLVGIIIDSFHDLRTGFLFGVSSAGVKYDQMFTNDNGNGDSSWDPNWWVKTSINKEGWIAEMKIPFSQVRFEKNSGDAWGFDVARILYRKNEQSFWQHIPRDAPGFVHLFGELKGLEQIKPRKIFDVTPYTVAKTETFQAVSENPFQASGKLSKLNGGIDAKIGVTNNMTMDLTINPDFGQVEADPSVVNLSAYETFFTEKRPFFIEGNNITNFGLGVGDGGVGNDNLFYSRRIGRQPQVYPDMKDNWYADIPTRTNIIGAAKLTGKTRDGLSIGIVEAMTAQENAVIDTIGGRKVATVEPFTNYFIGRVQKDINNGNTLIGGIFTSTNRELNTDTKDFLHKAAYTGGIDFTQYFKNKNWMFNLNTAFSLVEGSKKAITNTQESSAHYFQRPGKNYAVLDTNRTSLNGAGGRMQLAKNNGHWNFLGAALWKTPGFETNDLGYMRVTDQILGVLWCGYNQFNPKGIYKSYNLNNDFYSVYDFGGDWIGGGYEWNANINFKNFWSAWSGGSFNTPSISTDMLRGGPMMKLPGSAQIRAGLNSDSRKKLTLSVFVNRSQGYEGSSRNLYTEVDISYKPTNYLVFTISPSFNKSYTDLQYVTQTSYNGNDRYIFGAINQKTISTSFRINVNVSPNLTFQYWGQPFIATGKYFDYKFITYPLANSYQDRFWTYNTNQISFDGNQYNVDENVDGKTDYTIGKSDFNVKQFLSNFVVRWEYSPGSTLFLVWSQTRSYNTDIGQMDFLNNVGDLFSRSKNIPHNVFLIKFSYRFGLK
ncbi:MAG TPA: DUF5916 domain-containing protein [Bacteroidales bacterium]|nr:DUF5916 domain-containing protein [Bacteroidales bacterium]